MFCVWFSFLHCIRYLRFFLLSIRSIHNSPFPLFRSMFSSSVPFPILHFYSIFPVSATRDFWFSCFTMLPWEICVLSDSIVCKRDSSVMYIFYSDHQKLIILLRGIIQSGGLHVGSGRAAAWAGTQTPSAQSLPPPQRLPGQFSLTKT